MARSLKSQPNNVGGMNYNLTKNRQEKMNDKQNYTFGGFYFGERGLFQLQIKAVKHNGTGSSTSIELGIELTPDERQELITLLLSTPKENN